MSRNQILWTAADAASATGGKAVGQWAVTGLSIDTRTIGRGDLFVPLKDQRDGHDFIPIAVEKGAVVMSERPMDLVPALIVDDSLKALRDLGLEARARSAAIRIAVTGSVGKTSVKEAVAAALAPSGKTHKSIKSFNNHWGVPLTMAVMPADSDYGVYETGMNHAGELSDLSGLLAPNIAIITKIAPVHLEHFADVAAIAAAKAEIFDGMRAGGLAILPADDAFHAFLSQRAKAKGLKVVSVGTNDIDADLKLQNVGTHHQINAAFAMAVVTAVGANKAKARRALEGLAPIAGRGAHYAGKIGAQRFDIIDESYNANPESMAASLAAFKLAAPSSHKIAVLGDMLELGPNQAAFHVDLLGHILEAGIDRVITVGSAMKALDAVLPPAKRGLWVSDSSLLISALEPEVKKGSAVLFKASNSIGLGNIVNHLKQEKGSR